MSPIPIVTRDRWHDREQLASGQGAVYWHILFRDSPAIRTAAKQAQTQLASFSGLHMTPEEWLHATALFAGTTEDISGDDMGLMISEAQQFLAKVQPINVAVGKVLYHPEAIMLGFIPEGALDPIHDAVRQATQKVTGKIGTFTGPPDRWTPHITITYSTAAQPMAPIVAALGCEVPRCDATVDAISLVIQWGPERLWNWESIGTVHLGQIV